MLDVIYEDNHLLVVIKPQNVPSQSDKSNDEDMLSMVRSYIKEKYNKPGNVFVGLVHRLDRPTGGVMVFAKTSKAAMRLCEQIQNNQMHKKYLCVVCGKPKEQTAKLSNYLLKNEQTNIVSVVPMSTANAKLAELSYNVLDYNDLYSLVDVDLFTGRSHQIRVQMKYVGCPVFGDVKYGGKPSKLHKLALWSYELSFYHPTTKQKLTFRVLPPMTELPWKDFRISR